MMKRKLVRASLVVTIVTLLSTLCTTSVTAQDRLETGPQSMEVDLDCPDLAERTVREDGQPSVSTKGETVKGDSLGTSTLGPDELCPPPPPPPPPAGEFTHVIQMGDSYSAGVGALPGDPPLEFGQHVCDDPQYFRSEVTPGIRLARAIEAEEIFVACSGTLANTTIPGLDFSDQIDRLVENDVPAITNGGTETLIVYSIGGNDLRIDGGNWTTEIVQCVLPDDSICNIQPSPGAMEILEWEVRANHMAAIAAFPNATIRVMGYPLLANPAAGQPCQMATLQVDGVDFGGNLTSAEAAAVDELGRQVNQLLEDLVNDVASETGADIEYVNPASESRPGSCQTQGQHVNQWILNGSDVSMNTFHPTPAGYQGMYQDLALNLGILAEDPVLVTNVACEGGTASTLADPWQAHIGPGANIRGAASNTEVLNGTIQLDDISTVSVIVDMLGEPLGSADITAFVEVPGGAAAPISLSPFCYQGTDGTDRGYYQGTATLRTDDPYTSLVTQLRDSSGDLIASGHSGIASVERLEDNNTLETIGVRLNDSALSELADVAEFEIERVLEDALRGLGPRFWVADVSGVSVSLSSLAPGGGLPNGGLRAEVSVADVQVVVRGPLGWERCNWRLDQNAALTAIVDLGFDPASAATTPLSVHNVAGFGALDVNIVNAATQEVQFCGAIAASIAADFLALGPNSVLTQALWTANLTDTLWLVPINGALGNLLDAQVERLQDSLDALTGGVPVSDAISIGALEGDGDGVFVAIDVTLPGGPAVDNPFNQTISASLAQATAQGEDFDISGFIELAAINRVLALGAGPFNLVSDLIEVNDVPVFPLAIDVDRDSVLEEVYVALTAAPYLTRAPGGTPCRGLCAEANLPPLRLSIYESGVWDRDLLITAEAPIAVTSIGQQADGTIDLAWATDMQLAATVLRSADGTDTVAGFPAAAWALAGSPLILSMIDDLLPASVPLPELPPEIGVMNPTLAQSLNDVDGNTDLQLLLDLDFAPTVPEVPECDGRVPTIVGTPFDDVIFGTSGDDVIHALGGNDLVEGGGGDDYICGGPGNGILDGEQGDDRIFGFHSEDFIRAGSGDDVVWAGEADDFLIGDAGRDWLDGAGGDDIILGQAGDDIWLVGGPGQDFIDGGDGDDIIRGEEGDDDIDGGTGRDEIRGGDGDDTIRGGPDTIFITDLDADEIRGDDGDDVIYAGARQDEVWGGAGNDQIHGGRNEDTIWGGSGNDEVWGGNDRDDIYGGTGDDVLRGEGGRDDIWGGSGNDQVWGGNDRDDIWGGDGNDVLRGENGRDDIWGGSGTDVGYGGSGNDNCRSDVETQDSC